MQQKKPLGTQNAIMQKHEFLIMRHYAGFLQIRSHIHITTIIKIFNSELRQIEGSHR